MKYTRSFSVLVLFLLTACGVTPTKNESEYHTDFIFPEETENLVFKDLHVYDEPLFGASLSYVDPAYPSDNISVYVYPIRATEWENREEILQAEMDAVYAEVKQAYQSVSEETRSDFAFATSEEQFKGLKSSFDFDHQGREINSFAYLFLSKDKYIKFRTSFDAQFTPDWNGDQIVQEILPGIAVPEESSYMKNLRQEQREIDKQRQQALMKLIMEAVEKGELELIQDKNDKDNETDVHNQQNNQIE